MRTHALGHLTGDQAIKIAVERARRFGAGLVAVRHGFHFGTARRFALQGRRRGLHRHRHVQHAAADAGAGRRRTRGGKQSDRDRRAVRWPGAHRARHGDERGRDGQDPHGREGGGEDPRHLGGQGRRQRDNGSGRSDCRHAAAGERAERLWACLSDRSSVRRAVGRCDGQRGATALRQCVHALRLVAPFHCDRHRAFRRSRGNARGRDGCRGTDPRGRARARRRAAVHARRAGMGQARKRGGAGDAAAGRRRNPAAAGKGIAGARRCPRSRPKNTKGPENGEA